MLPDHLGGHGNKTHLDEGSLKFMQRIFNVKTMLDIGCGPGGMVNLARELGIDSYGIDGDYTLDRGNVDQFVTLHDYTTGPSPFDKKVDLAWSCEFVEHVEEQYIDNFMQDFRRANFVIMTFAPLGKEGHHHVNCNTEQYWKDTFKQYGFQFDANMTRQIKEVSSMGRRKKVRETGKKFWWKAFVKDNGLCFVKV
jgi:cyclopropane fatty-acyl-phospholipid synthase-like methyltransferase